MVAVATSQSPQRSGLVFYVHDGWEYVKARRSGRFAIPLDCWLSPIHRAAAIKEQWGKMLVGLGKKGFSWLGDKPEVRGPLDHLEISDDASADPGLSPEKAAQILNPEQRTAWEKAERARAARSLGLYAETVDAQIVATFKRKVRRAPRLVARSD